MPSSFPVCCPLPPGRVSRLSWAVLAVVVVAGVLALHQSWRLSAAERDIPPLCIMMLSDLPEKTARRRGVALSDCVGRRVPARGRALVIGPWRYGPVGNPIEGFIVHVRQPRGEAPPVDRVMHVSVVNSRVVLNDFSMTGQGCTGGVAEVYVRGGSFGLVLNLTPEGVLRFGDALIPAEAAGVRSDATACAAKLVMTDRRPTVIQFTPQTGRAQSSAALPRQACFDKMVSALLNQGRTALSSPEEHAAFVAAYKEQCLRQEEDERNGGEENDGDAG